MMHTVVFSGKAIRHLIDDGFSFRPIQRRLFRNGNGRHGVWPNNPPPGKDREDQTCGWWRHAGDSGMMGMPSKETRKGRLLELIMDDKELADALKAEESFNTEMIVEYMERRTGGQNPEI